MIPLNLSSLTSSSSSSSHRQMNGGCDSCLPTPTSDDDRCRCRQSAMMTGGEGGMGGRGGGGGGGRAKRVRFADDEMRKRPMRKRKEHHQLREWSSRKRQRTGADENKGDNTTDDDTQMTNYDWSESTHLYRSTTTPVMMMTTTASTKQDDYDNDENSLSPLHLSTTDHGRSPFPSIPIPHDPRLWSRLDVYNWLEHMKSLEIDLGDLDTARFLMNGKALCLMTPAMFIYRVPHGGRILYKDFQTRLCRAVAEVQYRRRTPI